MTTLRCPAKVNLFLAIRERDVSGYHEIETVLARTSALEDLIDIEPAEHFEFHCDSLPAEGNSVVKAVQVLQEHTGRIFKGKITLRKNIPPCSGLGGGASDAAAILLHFNAQEKLGLDQTTLQMLAAQIGMDVPFFVSGHEVALATHYGEKVFPLQNLPPKLRIIPELTGHKMATPEAYARWDEYRKEQKKMTPVSSKFFLAALQHQDSEGLVQNLHNDFEAITPECGPYTKNRHLCGSGGAVFQLIF